MMHRLKQTPGESRFRLRAMVASLSAFIRTPFQGVPKNSGNVLVMVLGAAGAIGVIIAGLNSTINNRLSSQRSEEYQEELKLVRSYIIDTIHCSKTIENQACGANYDPNWTLSPSDRIFLKGAKGIDLSDGTIQGYPSYGRWAMRARCIKSTNRNFLQVAVARYDRNGQAIVNSPLTKKPLGWMPLFNEQSPYRNKLCQAQIGDPVLASHLKVEDLDLRPSEDCSFAADKLLNVDIPKLWRKSISCPAGKTLVTGGAQCGTSEGNILTGSKRGHIVTNKRNGNAWEVACCQVQQFGSGAQRPKGYAVCL